RRQRLTATPYARSLHDALPIFSANSGIRKTLKEAEAKYGWKTFVPKFEYTTDNAAMIGIAGYYKYGEAKFEDNAVTSKARIEFRSEEHTSELQSRENLVCRRLR